MSRKNSNQMQSCKQNEKNQKMINFERAKFDDMNQPEWFPVVLYCN